MLAFLSKGQPGNYKYLPTMPHDDLVEVTASLSGRLGQATKWFMCREGHPYAIGDCGQPNQLGKCPCGAPIGGSTHGRFEDTGNNVQQQRQADLTDKTRDGIDIRKLFIPSFATYILFRIHSRTLGSNGK